jgi:hypothetical protein
MPIRYVHGPTSTGLAPTVETPNVLYTTIAAAVSGAVSGDTVQISAGTYTESVNIGIGKGITLQGAGIDQTIITAPANNYAVRINNPGSTQNITIKDLTVNGTDAGPAAEISSIFLNNTMGNLDINGCKLVANGDYALLTNGITATSFKVRNCQIVGKTFVGSAPAAQTWTGSYFTASVKLNTVSGIYETVTTGGTSAQFIVPNIPRQLIVLNSGTYGSGSEFTNNIIGDANSASGGAVTGDVLLASHRANTVMTCDAAGIDIAGNTFNTPCFPLLTATVALRVRGNGCVVRNNTFKDPVNNGYILDNKTLGTSQNTNNVTYSNNTIDFSSATVSSGHTFSSSSYSTTSSSGTRVCWAIAHASYTAPLNVLGLSRVIESNKSSHFVYPTAGSLSTIASAISAASSDDAAYVGPGTYAEQVGLNKKLTLKGAGASNTIVTYNNVFGRNLHITKGGVSVQDMKFTNNVAGNDHVALIARESNDVDAAGISLSGVEFVAVTKGVAINGVSNVTLTNCVFPQTLNYSLGLASVKGCVMSGCTVPASAFGSVGVFPTTDGAYGPGQVLADKASTGIDIANNTFSGPENSGVVQIQPGAGPAISYGFGSENVKLPASFLYAYLQKVVSNPGDIEIPNTASSTVSNVQFYGRPGALGTPNTGATFHAALQSIAPAGTRFAIYGKNLSNNTLFTESAFNPADLASGITELLSTFVSDLTSATTSSGVNVTVAGAVSSALGAVDKSNPGAVTVAAGALLAQAAVAASAGGVAADAPGATLVQLVAGSNNNYKNDSAAIGQKAGVAEASENRSSVTLSASEASIILNTLKGGNVSSTLTSGKGLTVVPAKSVIVNGVRKRYIIKPSAPATSIEYTPMIPGVWYNLLLDTEVIGGVPTEPADQAISQLKFEDDKLYYRATSSSVVEQKAIANTYAIVRSGVSYNYDVAAIGGSTSTSSGIPCFPAGQRVLTVAGWRAVETLRNGDKVITGSGAVVPAKIYSSSVITNTESAPITIAAGALGKNTPSMPVRLSPRHAIGMSDNTWQFPCNMLRMGARGVTQDAPGAKVDYYHIALPNYLRDNLVLEGGLVAESYGAPFVKANGISPSKVYTFSKTLGAFTRMSHVAVATKSTSA